MLVQIIDFFLAAQCHVTGQCDDFYTRSQYEECHVETNLVVTCPCRTMSDSVCSNLVGITCNGKCLENTLGTYGNRIGAITQHVAEYHVFQALFVIFLSYVDSNIFFCAQFIGVFFVRFQLFRTEATGVCTSCIHFVPLFFGKVHYRK